MVSSSLEINLRSGSTKGTPLESSPSYQPSMLGRRADEDQHCESVSVPLKTPAGSRQPVGCLFYSHTAGTGSKTLAHLSVDSVSCAS